LKSAQLILAINDDLPINSNQVVDFANRFDSSGGFCQSTLFRMDFANQLPCTGGFCQSIRIKWWILRINSNQVVHFANLVESSDFFLLICLTLARIWCVNPRFRMDFANQFESSGGFCQSIRIDFANQFESSGGFCQSTPLHGWILIDSVFLLPLNFSIPVL